MDLTLTSDQEQFTASVGAFLAEQLPLTRLHDNKRVGAGDESYRPSIAEMGFYGMGLPEAAGGSGFSLIDEALLFREVGRNLGPVGLLPALLAAHLLASDQSESPLLADILAGQAGVALAVAEGPVQVSNGQVSGSLRLYDCHAAEYAVFLHDGTAVLFSLQGCQLNVLSCLDKSTSMAVIEASALAVQARVELRLIDRFFLHVAAMLVGQAEATRDMINAYAKIRFTFGRAIGSYQAVRHPIAEMAARCELAFAQLRYAALALQEGRNDAAAHVGAALLVARNAAMQNADSNIQLHGGIGVTDELDAHLYLKRAHLLIRWCGLQRDHLHTVLVTPIDSL